MKKTMKVTQGKRFLSLVLAIIMMVTVFNMALPMLKLDASAVEYDADGNIVIGGITQKRVVGNADPANPTYPATYEKYADNFLNGAGKATDIVIPGLPADDDFIVQGLSYFAEKDWIMVSAYHKTGALPSMIFAMDAKSGDFKGAFAIYNTAGLSSPNYDHGGGLAFSEYNFYYSGDDSDKEDGDGNGDADQIAYAPLDKFRNPEDTNGDGLYEIILKGAVDLPEMGGAATAYVCYDEGILWAGNFYEDGVGGGDYSTPVVPAAEGINLQNSMIYGYKLQGNSSDEEWAYLTGSEGNAEDCAGNPSHCVAVHTDFEDIQYAIVDNGKLYLSRSWGTGKNDDLMGSNIIQSVGSTPDYSTLTVGEIDLSAEGTEPIQYTVNGTTIKRKAHMLSGDKVKHFDMMPMSEGLCFIDGDLYISFEGASNKYMNEYAWGFDAITNTGNCDYPIDVVWKVDPYKLMGEERVEISDAVCFEKVNKINDISENEEYIIVYESPEIDPVTQKNILYAFDANGNFKDLNLSKSTDTSVKGYDGMIGHPISEYSIEGNKLYLTNEEDDLESMRWVIMGAKNGELRIQSPLQYYSSNRNFFFNNDKISMMNDVGMNPNPLALVEVGDTGKFYLKNGESYIWCNDFSVAGYEGKANTWYGQNSNTAMYANLKEEKGTFHTDALNKSQNIIGASIDTTNNDYLRQISIYKCVVDNFTSTEKNRVYTDMSAELKADGTYTINLETYATGALHYKAAEAEKPTDFIFVLDTSSSMSTGDGTGMIPFNGNLSAYSVDGERKKTTVGVTTADHSIGNDPASVGHGDIYVKLGDEYINLSVEGSESWESGCDKYKSYWLYGTYHGQVHYWLPNSPTDATQGGTWVLDKPAQDKTMAVAGGNDKERATGTIYYGEHYRYTTTDYHNLAGTSGRYITMQESANNIINKIVSDAQINGLDHRFAVTQFGGTNGFYPANSGSISTGTDYSNAFWSIAQAETLKSTINSTSASGEAAAGVEFSHANGILEANKSSYTSIGEDGRSVAVIFFSDGLAGSDSSATSANNVINMAKTAKEKGAFVYTVTIGSEAPSAYKKATYMQAISSQYPEASSLTSLGGECTESVGYTIDLSNSSSVQFTTYVDGLIRDVKTNNTVAVEKLAGDTVIVEQLSDAFIIPENYEYSVEFYKGYYDKLDRFQFAEEPTTPTGITHSVITNEAGRAIQVNGYNYSTQYISKGHDGNKLKITIEGLLANPEANITNTSVNNTETTAIYKSAGSSAFKFFPTEYFNIPKYTYVLDYGLYMLDTDVNGTLKAVSEGLTKQDINNYIKESENGLVAIQSGDQNLLYHTTPTNTTDSGYVLIQRDNGEYDWFEIEVVPASNVYFEETEFATTAGTGTVAWGEATGGTSASHRELPKELDVDGYDEAYNNTNTYSNGKTLSATVDANNKRSKTATVTFTGDGIDLVSACGPKTGMQLIIVKDKDGKSVKASIVDTYYAADSFSQVPIFSFRGANGTYTVETTALYLTTSGAVIANGGSKSGIKNNLIDTGLVMNSSENLNTAEVQAMLDAAGVEDIDAENLELVWFDDNSVFNGGTGVAPTKKGTRAETSSVALENYLDGFRIYNPLGATSGNYTESEQNASYINVIKNLAPVGDGIDSLDGIGFITGSLAEGEKLSFSNYESVGPTDELYLLGGKAITFKADVNIGEKVMLGLRAVKGETTLKITSDKTDNSVEVTVKSATEMYYDITKCIGEIATDGTEVQIIVQNTGSNMLAVNQIKFSGGTKVNTGNTPVTRSLSRSGEATEVYSNMFLPLTEKDLVEVENGLTVKETVQGVIKNGVILPVVEEENPDDNTTPDTGDDTNNDNNDDTNTDSGEKEEFSIFSLLELLLSLIEKILHNAFGTGNLF